MQSGLLETTLAKKSLQETNRVSVFEHAVDFLNFQICNVRGCMFVLFSVVSLVFLAVLCFRRLSSSAQSRSRQASAVSRQTKMGRHMKKTFENNQQYKNESKTIHLQHQIKRTRT